MTVLSKLPGRIRLKSKDLRQDYSLAVNMERALSSVRGIRRLELNPRNGNLLIYYDEGLLCEEELLALLEEQVRYHQRSGRKGSSFFVYHERREQGEKQGLGGEIIREILKELLPKPLRIAMALAMAKGYGN